MNIKITELKEEYIEKYNIKEFLFNMIKTCYNMDYIPQYHYDIVNLKPVSYTHLDVYKRQVVYFSYTLNSFF